LCFSVEKEQFLWLGDIEQKCKRESVQFVAPKVRNIITRYANNV
jgi:hypothetical protein